MRRTLGERIRAARRLRWAIDTVAPVRDWLEPLGGSLLEVGRLLRRRDRDGAGRLLYVLAGAQPGGLGGPDPVSIAHDLRLLFDALMVPSDAAVRIEGGPAGPVGELLGERLGPRDGDPGTIVYVDVLGRDSSRTRRARLGAAASVGATVVVVELLWPEGRTVVASGTPRRLHRHEWWAREGRRCGLGVGAEVRARPGEWSCFALMPDGPVPPRLPPRVTADPLRLHLDDDLSLSSSFSWISAALALALRDTGATVSIEPTALSPALGDIRGDLRALMRPAPRDRHAAIGWTHFWPQYHRALVAPVTLALFAVNYEFDHADPGALDPWLAGVVGSGMGLAPISTFCRDVLVEAGADPRRCAVVPMGRTGSRPRHVTRPELHGASGLRILHVTNAADPERHGTIVALEAFRALLRGGHRATLVVRDYGSGSGDLARRVAALRAEGLDARYWPVFYAESELVRAMSAFDVLLAPFRGEGFGIKLLDAMAAGLPVVGPFFGGPRDFLDDTVAFRVEHSLVPMRSGYDADRLRFGRVPLWAEVDPGSLLGALIAAAEDPASLQRRRAAAIVRSDAFTWAHTAAAVKKAVEASLGEAGR